MIDKDRKTGLTAKRKAEKIANKNEIEKEKTASEEGKRSMKRMKQILLLIGCAWCVAVCAKADEVSFRAQAPAQVIVGKPFQLTYSVNQRSRDLKAPQIADFDILAGPYTSTSSSTSFVNGKRTSTFTQTYTYTLMAQKAGTYTIPPARITVSGDEYTSNGVRITVLPPDEQPQESANNNAQRKQGTKQGGGEQDLSENLFVRTIVSKTKVHEQEAIALSYKLYFAGVDVAQLTNNTQLPEFTGFLKQEVDLGEIQTELEHYNGRNYQTAVLYQTLLYPQHAGEIKIDPASFEAVLRVQTRAQVRSIFDDFFGTYTNVTRTIKAPGVTIAVEGLPKGKPANFIGGVGQFTLSSSLSQDEMMTNEAVTLQLTIEGTGNMKLLKTPAVDWPEGFEPYDPKVNNQFKTTAAGMSGKKTIEYLAIPRAAGEYTIPAITIAYYDTQEDAYKTLSTPEYTLKVNRTGNEQASSAVVSNYVNKEDIKSIGTDIRYIHTDALPILRAESGDSEKWMGLAWAGYVLPLAIAMVLFLVFRRQIKENADANRVRYKRANKVAQKRLKKAAALLKEGKAEEYYTEIERALWMYLSDRLSIDTASLNKDNIASILRDKQQSEEVISQVMTVLSNAEFARYAPSAAKSKEELLEATREIINTLENNRL